MGLHAVLLVFVVCYNLLFHSRVQCDWNTGKQENFELERQLKLLNKPAVKTIANKYGEIYDCIDFYKQPAFDHPLLKNHTFDFQTISSALYGETGKQDPSSVAASLLKKSQFETCPVGSVPIRRITKDDLIRERQYLEGSRMDHTNRPGTYLAVARTTGDQIKYTGGACFISTHNPKVSDGQYTTARIKLQNGHESIEAGWRVDPALYGDNKTRLFVRTDAGKSHCFNTRCPGFVHTSREYPLGFVFTHISIPGGPTYDWTYRIAQDNRSKNWNLILDDKNVIGFWPSRIFTGLKEWANYVEWGGAASSRRPGSPLPQMGTGNLPVFDTLYDGYFGKIEVVNERGQSTDPPNINTYEGDASLYSARTFLASSRIWGRGIVYGGPGLHKRN